MPLTSDLPRSRARRSRALRTLALVGALAAFTAVSPGSPAGASSTLTTAVTTTNACLTSVPDPGTTAPVAICYTVFQPAGTGAGHRVPMVLQSHGWGGKRTKDAASFSQLLDAGYAVLSFDQRGFGESGGQAYVENPDVEGHDVLALIDVVSSLDWVQMDGPGDPRMGAIGGSYGGGYQFLAAFESLRTTGKPIFDALAPEITWNDLQESLSPNGVTRSTWSTALTAAAVPSNAMPTVVVEGLAKGLVTGDFPESLVAFFAKNGPQFHTEHGRVLDIPVLLGQGTTDSLFPLEQGLQNFQTAITPEARAKSIFVGYNGGHVLPAVVPSGIDVTSDPCSTQLAGGTFADLTLRFFDEQLKGLQTGLTGYGDYHLATPSSTCVTVDSVEANTDVPIGTVLARTGPAGVPSSTLVAAGPITIAGTPYLTGKLSTTGPQSRAFFGLAVGDSPLTAHLVQNNVEPVNEPTTVTGEKRRLELPSVAVEVPAGQNLYLLTSPVSDSFVGMGSRAPGQIKLKSTTVSLPVVRR